MSGDGMDCNGGRLAVVTYKRKRAGAGLSAAAGRQLQDDDGQAHTQVFNRQSRKKKVKDIGWEHGVIVHGNRFHWQCNWCGLVRYGGGVSRLKRHIAGTSDTVKCPKVPEHIAIDMRNYLMEKEKQREKRRTMRDMTGGRNLERPHLDLFADKDGGHISLEIQPRNATQHSRKATKRSRSATRKLKSKFKRFETTTLWSGTDIDEDTVLYNRTHEEDGFARRDHHWRNVLKHMLQLPYSGGSIMCCIDDALNSRPFGPQANSRMNDDLTSNAYPKDRFNSHFEEHSKPQSSDMSINAKSAEPKTEIDGQADTHVNTTKCQKVFLDILLSEEFALLCDLLCQSFLHMKYKNIFDFSLINSKMKSGDYEDSPGLFDQDIQQVWDKFQKIGQEMVLLSSSLSRISQASFQEQAGEGLGHASSEKGPAGTKQLSVEQNNSMVLHATSKFPSYGSQPPSKLIKSKPCLPMVSTCKQCGVRADGNCSLICNGCGLAHHFSCTEPPALNVPAQSWSCSNCLPVRVLTDGQQENLHENCAVCSRLAVSEAVREVNESSRGTLITNYSRENSVSDKPPEPSGTALSRLCKQCGSCEDEDKRFLVCGNAHCLYRYYHIRCLKSSQVASYEQQNQPCWYCPSCLCRACLSDKDDEKIVMCDGCDEAYHTYCMKPPLASIPEGKWYCVQCNVARAKEGMQKFELWVLKQHTRRNVTEANGANMSVDLLLKAAEKLSSEEGLPVGKNERMNSP